MALTDEQLAYYRTQLGTVLDVVDLETRYTRLGDDAAVAGEVLQQRLADLLAAPSSFAIPGEYSQSTTENIKAIRAQLDDLLAGDSPGGLSTVTIVQPGVPPDLAGQTAGTTWYDTYAYNGR